LDPSVGKMPMLSVYLVKQTSKLMQRLDPVCCSGLHTNLHRKQ
jgi:hypothetical protein